MFVSVCVWMSIESATDSLLWVHTIQGWGLEEESWMAAIEQRISTGVHGNWRLLVVGREGGRDGASSEKDFDSRAGYSHLLELIHLMGEMGMNIMDFELGK